MGEGAPDGRLAGLCSEGVLGQLVGWAGKQALLAHVFYFSSLFLFLLPILFILLLFGIINQYILDYISIFFIFLYITKASPRLTPYRLKGKKGVARLASPYRFENYGRR